MNLTVVFSAGSMLFPGGVRLSTWLALLAFLALAAWRGDGRPFVAGLAWLWGFEAAYQITCILTGNGSPASTAPVLIPLGVVCVVAAKFYGVRPSWSIMVPVGVIWAIWIAVGFPANGHGLTDFNPTAEVLNEAAKLLWAAAYFVPLLRVSAGVAGSRASDLESPRLPAEPRA